MPFEIVIWLLNGIIIIILLGGRHCIILQETSTYDVHNGGDWGGGTSAKNCVSIHFGFLVRGFVKKNRFMYQLSQALSNSEIFEAKNITKIWPELGTFGGILPSTGMGNLI